MSGAFVLISGELFREPQSKISKNGKPYATGTLKVSDGDTVNFWNLVCFGDAAEELGRLSAGEGLSAQGKLRTEIYLKAGEARVSHSILASTVLALRAPKKPPKQKPKQEERAPPRVEPTFDDGFPTEGVWGGPDQ